MSALHSPLRGSLAAVVLLAAALAAPDPAYGQASSVRDGSWLSAGPAAGFDESMRWGAGIHLGAGIKVAPRLHLGVQAFRFEADPFQRAGSKTRNNVTVTATVFPSAGGFFVRTGVGLATEEYQELVPGSTSARWRTSEYVGASVGLGHDVRLGDGDLFLSPGIDALLGLDEDGLDNPDFSLLLTVQLGLR